MTKAFRLEGYHDPVWKMFRMEAHKHCPECGCKDTLHYIGFAQNYSPSLYAKLYTCSECEAWVDCVWPKVLGKPSNLEAAAV